MIPNPDYYDDDNLYHYPSFKYVGLEIWQVKSGTIFDNFIITDDAAEAAKFAERTNKSREGEKKMHDKQEEEKKAKEEEERKAKEAAEKDDAPEDHDHKDEL